MRSVKLDISGPDNLFDFLKPFYSSVLSIWMSKVMRCKLDYAPPFSSLYLRCLTLVIYQLVRLFVCSQGSQCEKVGISFITIVR